MTIETDLVAALQALCPRVFADTAETKTARPYVIWQRIGGEAQRYVDNTPIAWRSALLQIDVWADHRLEADALAQAIEEALCQAAGFTADVEGESTSLNEPDLKRYGTSQDFTLWGPR
jgi:hypothetical protein